MLTSEARIHLGDLSRELEQVEPWTAETTEEAVRAFAQRTGMKLGNIAQPMRVALTGRITSPPIFEVLAVLGKYESLARMREQLGSVELLDGDTAAALCNQFHGWRLLSELKPGL